MASNNAAFIEDGLRLIPHVADVNDTFTADDIRILDMKKPKHQNAWGSLFSLAARRKLIRRVGYRPSTNPSTHGRVVSVWRGI